MLGIIYICHKNRNLCLVPAKKPLIDKGSLQTFVRTTNMKISKYNYILLYFLYKRPFLK